MKQYGLLITGILTLAACQSETSSDTTASTTTEVDDNRPTYVVMTELNTIPFIIRDSHEKSGLTGFEYDLLTAIAEQQGFKLRFDVHPWQGLFQNLETGKADILAGAVTYTDERAKIMDFSNPHFEYRYTMLVRKDLNNQTNFAAFRGMKVALQKGSVSESLAPMFATPDENNIQRTDTIWLATKAVLSGEADAAIGSSAPLSYYAKQYAKDEVKLIQDTSLPAQNYVFAVRKGNTELAQKLNDGLAKVKANGTYDQLYKKYW
ncbi:transporter substrate-binding domain-containing protein [Wielerella bovis]|uniref:transporter substrate-binding domain-containing protein n=1 Tax=Wielerella bovis TaxID=2917790 RepID=UPI002019A7AA|nr:transporter substrate-binding domain-containing protein [Wielerella bovis]ULJ61350.1 transporter substrate-binding domain-containing protein [Wielerella bovis]